MNSKIFVFILFVVLLVGCKKDDDNTGPNGLPMHSIRFTCTSDNPYLVEIHKFSDVVQGHSFIDYDLQQYTYSWKVTQQSGYFLYPTTRSGTVTLDQDKEIVFP